MTPADTYRVTAAKFAAMARSEKNRDLNLEYLRMEQSYLRLAMLADRNTETDVS